MRHRLARLVRLAGASAFVMGLLPGCQLFQNNATDGGSDTTASWTSAQMEVTIAQGVHYGPGVPSGSASLINSRDEAGNLNGGTFTLDATVDGAECSLSLSRFGAGTGFAVGSYAINANVGDTTPNQVVYPQGTESVNTPAGNASCNGSDCNGATFVINQADSAHVYGYFMAGDASSPLVCTFWVPLAAYVP